MKIYIKNMVCDRCIMAVEKLLDDSNMNYRSVRLGEVELVQAGLSDTERQKLASDLEKIGFALIDDKKSQIIEAIKTKIIELVHRSDGQTVQKLSVVLADELSYDYNYLSNLFSSIEGVTVEHYYIQQRIERVKELLVYNELNMSEISVKMGYSSVAYLSSQFKKVTGLTPTHFKKIRTNKRSPLDKV
jgi:YesN/AraC family two-component response regulator